MPTYKDAGVDLEKADRLVDTLAAYQQRTEDATSRSLFRGFGDFAASYDLSSYENPVVLSSCDGVGTKFILQKRYDELESAGQDLVAMNVNDLLTTGGEPLLFLDYVAMSPLENDTIEALVDGMARACEESNCLLAGGETAELPGMVDEGDVELAGFCVGAAEKDQLQNRPDVEDGQVVLGLPSDGIHANGFSLVRKVLDENPEKFDDEDIRSLLTPTRLYYDTVTALQDNGLTPPAMVHVTGGGIEGNLSRVLPEDTGADVSVPEWTDPVIERVLQYVPDEEALRTFNMGFGWLLVVDPDELDDYRDVLPEADVLGTIRADGELTVRYGKESNS
jgi:phosphoribosylformylglycinamidine cyclo-ligase